MTSISTQLIILISIISYELMDLSYSQWISPTTPLLPPNSTTGACGHYHNIVYIIGGTNNGHYDGGLIEYDVNKNTFTTKPSFFPKRDSRSDNTASQWWSQMDNILYMTRNGYTIDTFNLITKQFHEDAYTGPATRVEGYSCLTSDPSQSSLYYVGGYNSNDGQLNTLQILNIKDKSWSMGPNMKTSRIYLSCIVSTNQQLYAIGGATDSPSIEMVSTINIKGNQWSYIDETLYAPLAGHRSVLYDHNIFVIGGLTDGITDQVLIIDTQTNNVSVASDRLAYPVFVGIPIAINNIIYTFGGSSDPTNRWQYISMPTPIPTSNPTKDQVSFF